MSEFEHDDELRDALRRAHPARSEAGPMLAANRARMARARSRRRAAVGSIAAASFVAIGAAVFAANGSGDTNVVDVVAPPSTVSTVSTTEPGDRPGTTTAAPSSSTTRGGADQTTTIAQTPPESSTQPTTTATATASTSTTLAARTTHSGRGGTITVTRTATAMSVEQITDVVGWTHTVNKNDSDDIEVEWRRSDPEDDAKIRLRLVDGSIREEIE
jgi:hypothetical protein